MSYFRPIQWSGWGLALTLGLLAMLAQGEEFRYRYISLAQVELPPGFTLFSPGGINDSGRVYGTVCDDACSEPHIAFYKDGTVTVFQSVGFGGAVNAGGTVGGTILVDPQNFIGQAALFRGDEVERIPPQPGEAIAFVLALNDLDTALVESHDASGQITYVLYSKGLATRLDFGPTITNPSFSGLSIGRFINNEGILAGTARDRSANVRGFRFDSRTGETTLLDPLPTETIAWGLGINTRGDVLGYSFNSYPHPYQEHIGVWDRSGDFKPYFFEKISSNALQFNDNNLIVITLITNNQSYLVPEPGVRLNLADLVENLPSGQDLRYIFGINNHGDMIGFDSSGAYFLLERIGQSNLSQK